MHILMQNKTGEQSLGHTLVRNGKLDFLGKQTSTFIGVYIIILRTPSPSGLH